MMNAAANKLLAIRFKDYPKMENTYLHIDKDFQNRFVVSLESTLGTLWVAEEDYLTGAFGKGTTIQEAVTDLYKQLIGKTLLIQDTDDNNKVIAEYESAIVA